MPRPHVLVAEDDDATRSALGYFLDSRGFEVLEARDGRAALEMAAEAEIIVLDVMMPKLNGWQVAEQLHELQPETPVLMVTALGSTNQKLHGFELGVDDYMVKPVDLHELEARLRALMRRAGIRKQLVRGPITVHPDKRIATVRDKQIDLSPLEFDLLHKLALHPGRAWSRSELLQSVWGTDYFGVDRTVDVRVAGLRKKLGPTPSGGSYIETVRGHGYRFVLDADLMRH